MRTRKQGEIREKKKKVRKITQFSKFLAQSILKCESFFFPHIISFSPVVSIKYLPNTK